MTFMGSGTEDTAVSGGRRRKPRLKRGPGYGHDYQMRREFLHQLLQIHFPPLMR